MSRLLSFSEISRALDCQAKWDFEYGGHLAGTALKSKTVAPMLSGGRAWGAAVASLHSGSNGGTVGQAAIIAMDESLEIDAERQRRFGLHDQTAHDELRARLLSMLLHYIDTAELFRIERIEHELRVPIPSRTGMRSSNRYQLLCYLDGIQSEINGDWLVEFKLRGRLSPVFLIELSRQLRWYAWAYWQQTGVKVIGVKVVERLNEVPKPARILASGKPSHAKDQMTTVQSYTDACLEFGEEPHADVVEVLGQRIWQQTVPIIFRDGELEEAGQELVSAAKLIHQLDNGDLMPLRNAKAANCNGCFFKEICPSPDPHLVDTFFERVPPKRDRKEEDDSHQPVLTADA